MCEGLTEPSGLGRLRHPDVLGVPLPMETSLTQLHVHVVPLATAFAPHASAVAVGTISIPYPVAAALLLPCSHSPTHQVAPGQISGVPP
jgi:hypothetical protein